MRLNPSYFFIADQNPQGCADLCNQYGYTDMTSTQDIAACLQQIAQDNGESALQEIFNNHPDREIILHLYGGQSRTSDNGVNDINYRKRTMKNFYNDAGPVDGQSQPIIVPVSNASNKSENKSFITISSDAVFLGITILLGFYIVSLNKNK